MWLYWGTKEEQPWGYIDINLHIVYGGFINFHMCLNLIECQLQPRKGDVKRRKIFFFCFHYGSWLEVLLKFCLFLNWSLRVTDGPLTPDTSLVCECKCTFFTFILICTYVSIAYITHHKQIKKNKIYLYLCNF